MIPMQIHGAQRLCTATGTQAIDENRIGLALHLMTHTEQIGACGRGTLRQLINLELDRRDRRLERHAHERLA